MLHVLITPMVCSTAAEHVGSSLDKVVTLQRDCIAVEDNLRQSWVLILLGAKRVPHSRNRLRGLMAQRRLLRCYRGRRLQTEVQNQAPGFVLWHPALDIYAGLTRWVVLLPGCCSTAGSCVPFITALTVDTLHVQLHSRVVSPIENRESSADHSKQE